LQECALRGSAHSSRTHAPLSWRSRGRGGLDHQHASPTGHISTQPYAKYTSARGAAPQSAYQTPLLAQNDTLSLTESFFLALGSPRPDFTQPHSRPPELGTRGKVLPSGDPGTLGERGADEFVFPDMLDTGARRRAEADVNGRGVGTVTELTNSRCLVDCIMCVHELSAPLFRRPCLAFSRRALVSLGAALGLIESALRLGP